MADWMNINHTHMHRAYSHIITGKDPGDGEVYFIACGRAIDMNRLSYRVTRTVTPEAEYRPCRSCMRTAADPERLAKQRNIAVKSAEHKKIYRKRRRIIRGTLSSDIEPMDLDPAEWAQRILNLRTHLDFSQDELALELGVATATVCRWESGFYRPSRIAMRAVAYIERELDLRGIPK